MEIFYFSIQKELDDFIRDAADQRGAEFLQSWRWGELLKAEKASVLRLGVRRTVGQKLRSGASHEILAAATMVKYSLGAGLTYWYAPRGVIYNKQLSDNDRITTENYLYLETKKIDPAAVFMRIEPATAIAENIFGCKKTIDLQPKQTLILDINKSEAELLQEMHHKTRYNVNLAVKKVVIIKEGDLSDFPEFWRLMSLTGTRDDFRLHSEEHYRHLLSIGSDVIKFYFAVYEGRNIAAGIFYFWGDKATYLHGASDNEFRNVMAPYLLQWTVIKQAKKEGFRYYDFYGINEDKWPGVTRFKQGFGGRVENYLGTHDIVFRPGLYCGYGLIRKLKRLVK